MLGLSTGRGDRRGETAAEILNSSAFSPHFRHYKVSFPSDPMIINHFTTTFSSSPTSVSIIQYFGENFTGRKIRTISRTEVTHVTHHTMSACHVLFQQTSAQINEISPTLSVLACPVSALVSRLMFGKTSLFVASNRSAEMTDN